MMLTASRRSYYSFAYSASSGSLLGLSEHLVDRGSIEQLRSSAHPSAGPGSASFTVTPAFFLHESNPQGLLCPSCVDWTQLLGRISLDVSLGNLQGAVQQPVRFSTVRGAAGRNRHRLHIFGGSAMSLYFNIILFDASTDAKRVPHEHSMFVAMRQSRKALSSTIYGLGPNELRCSIEQKMRRHDFRQKVQFLVV